MYEIYSDLQREQLFKQNYKNTQSLRVAVYAPKNSCLLYDSLKRSLHQNYLVIREIEAIEKEQCDAVLIATQDCEFMSVTLMQFAAAMLDGFDFCWSDSVFGASQVTHCFVSEKFDHVNVAMLSKELFLDVVKNEGSIEPIDLIRHAARLAHSK